MDTEMMDGTSLAASILDDTSRRSEQLAGMLLLARNATVTYCHSKTRDLPDHVASADIVIAAVGIPNFVRGSWLKPGSVIIDAGYNPGNVGDVATDEALDVAAPITGDGWCQVDSGRLSDMGHPATRVRADLSRSLA